jgi:hypothetical protein
MSDNVEQKQVRIHAAGMTEPLPVTPPTQDDLTMREQVFCSSCGKRTGVRTLAKGMGLLMDVARNSRSGCCNAYVAILIDVADGRCAFNPRTFTSLSAQGMQSETELRLRRAETSRDFHDERACTLANMVESQNREIKGLTTHLFRARKALAALKPKAKAPKAPKAQKTPAPAGDREEE